VVTGVRIGTDWSARPPRELWRQRVGPGWSSVAVAGGRLFTQEQRGDNEAVVCYDAATGAEVWSHEDPGRFWEVVSEAGPRATPTIADGRIYAFGANGLLNCLDAATGTRLWSHDVAAEAGAKVPQWGFSCSPLVTEGVAIVFASGAGDKGLVAFRADTGAPAWTASAGQTSYGSPQPAVLAGRPQVLFFSAEGLYAVDPATGAPLWQFPGATPGAPRSLQPHPLGPSQVLISSEGDVGLVLLDVAHDQGSGWTVTQRWASKSLQPSFNDLVVHDGHAYGFDGALFGCADLRTGKRCWKEGRYGHGQMLLLAEQGLLLVVTEKAGEVVLLAADPAKSVELGRFKAVSGKTWNHPVVAHGRLYVRNGEEMACFELPQ
jgi:outer membrane protein assembly factor BamB